MEKLQKELLKCAYENYLKTYNIYFEFLIKKDNELLYYIEAAEKLSELGYIWPMSENIEADSILGSYTNHFLICYELTDKGIEKARTL